MPARLELSGRQFGRLTVLECVGQDRWRATLWLCECQCGTRVTVRGSTLMADRTQSCMSCAATASSTTHGQTHTPLYARWRAMISRTQYPSSSEYQNYGGRGITVCERWLTSFENFAADMSGSFADGLTLDRIDVDGNYEPGNCRWVTHREQQRNKRTNHLVTWRGKTMVITDWAALLGLKPNTLIYRLRRGWSINRALTKDADPAVLASLANGAPAVSSGSGGPRAQDGGAQ